MELEDPADYVCSVKWIKEGNVLAVGNLHGEISLWDVEQMKKMRTMTGHADRVGALCWNEVHTTNSTLLRIVCLSRVSHKNCTDLWYFVADHQSYISIPFYSQFLKTPQFYPIASQLRVFGSYAL